MSRTILAVGLREIFLQQLTDAIHEIGGSTITAPDLAIAGWLLEHRRFDTVLIDLNCMFETVPHIWEELRRRSIRVIVLGSAGTRYHWPVERAADRFFSYSISPQDLAACIVTLADHP